MTEEEARKVAFIVATADGGCSTCVTHLTKRLLKSLPGHDWASLVALYDENKGELEEPDPE